MLRSGVANAGPHGRYCLAHAGYASSNNNMARKVPSSAMASSFTATRLQSIMDFGEEHTDFLSKSNNLFQSEQVLIKRYTTSYRLFIATGVRNR